MSFRQWVSRIARSKGLNIFMWIWAIITILIIGMSWFGSLMRPDPLNSGATPTSPQNETPVESK